MVAFAGNSVLARLAMADGAIDPAGYTFLRLLSGAIVLLALVMRRDGVATHSWRTNSSWMSAAALFAYAGGFSFAYLALDTGMGALILFSCVQATMIGWGLYKGDRPSALEWLGMIIAFGAFAWLVSPGLTAPDPLGTFLMVVAGVAWGIYSLRGRGSTDALASTTGNFVRSAPMGLLLVVLFLAQADASLAGIVLAVLSGAITSGLGYALWYRCLADLTATRAAIVQLTVPAIAALGGVIFASEAITLRLALCSALILGGVAMAILAKQQRT